MRNLRSNRRRNNQHDDATVSDTMLALEMPDDMTAERGAKPERQLWCAVILRALHDMAFYAKSAPEYMDALRWLRSNDSHWGSFRWALAATEMDRPGVRERILRMAQSGELKLDEITRGRSRAPYGVKRVRKARAVTC